ncbi:carbonic anhydrase, putative [Ixodes scapularis]|uniref:Carbonic anhydrase, putative n=1 Tax=Ixodes scapularis TaxID=6945 RepID=B7QBP9_IXOSC|nr:carbonic anhydrase, putative [Ixodes scapularis]|eukprot:XP_002412963.1 carbonic anhydrase, putative [Ixodes scapularis]
MGGSKLQGQRDAPLIKRTEGTVRSPPAHAKVNGQLQNTGQGIVFRLSEDDHGGVNISMGPLSYRYRVYELRLHFGRTDDRGSEHSVSGFVFPAELQILGYNCDLYANVSEARQRAQGLVAVAAIIKLRDSANLELRLLTSQLLHLGFKDRDGDRHMLSAVAAGPSEPGSERASAAAARVIPVIGRRSGAQRSGSALVAVAIDG